MNSTPGPRSAGVRALNTALAVLLSLFTLAEVNYPMLSPQSRLAVFAMLGLVLCFLNHPVHPRVRDRVWARALDASLAALAVLSCGYIVVQSEPLFESLWVGGQSLGNRAGLESPTDIAVGAVGLLLVLEATRRAIGWALPILAGAFLLYALVGPSLPGWLFPHRGYGLSRIVSQTFLHSQGVFGTALYVMFTYVFLFVVFGGLLQQSGATQFIIDLARRLFGSRAGGPAKVAVLSSGMMGSLSGSAVANTATTGTFTIPMMRSSGFRPEIAAGVEAAASSGGALMPPVMGAGAYMMLEIIEPQVTYLQIVKAALIPAILYYLSLFLIVHFYARRVGAAGQTGERMTGPVWRFEGMVFFSSVAGLVLLLLAGYTVFRAVSVTLLWVVVLAAFNPRTRIGWSRALQTLTRAGRDAVPLVAAAACVGVIIGVVTLTGIGTKLPSTIMGLSQGNLLSALALIMVSSIILGMGLPSAVCYLLMATLIGPVLSELGIVPLAAHLFIFYFGMMSMVTPPVALAAYTAASIAGSRVMPTATAAFRFALVGFTLPYMFVLRPELLMMNDQGGAAGLGAVVYAVGLAVVGILALAAGIAGYLVTTLSPASRGAMLLAAALLLLEAAGVSLFGGNLPLLGIAGLAILLIVGWLGRLR